MEAALLVRLEGNQRFARQVRGKISSKGAVFTLLGQCIVRQGALCQKTNKASISNEVCALWHNEGHRKKQIQVFPQSWGVGAECCKQTHLCVKQSGQL